ncbi:SseB family protein [Allonocardiopsis opalescens]|uniref:Type III secretion system (T3SS) SseB-like protein n=1 Tax=Allonocardiopsis opalescens TaxID=1144618 RepID=A0A2T0Q3S7_9ACTN|nr:SseB family protein [Allonocardiopsis opalescens]PRX98459.1 type III secretion system (T3SS) SseB-like protein [Allonocardiopsis opalescens]
MPGPTVIGGDERFRGDDGSADPVLTAALRGYAADPARSRPVAAALAGRRLLVTMVTVKVPGGTEVRQPLLTGAGGRQAVPAFGSAEAVRRWRADARPVPAAAADVCRSAREAGAAVVIDVAGPVPYLLDGRALQQLADYGRLLEPGEDPEVLAAVHRATRPDPEVSRVRFLPAPDGGQDAEPAADLALQLELYRLDDAVVHRVARRLRTELGPLLPGGVALSAVAAPPGAAR